MYYADSTDGFYDKDIHSVIPEDAIEITKEEYKILIAGQSTGKRIKVVGGKPILVDPDPLTDAQVRKQYEVAIQHHLDSAAQVAGYDDIRTVVTYAEEPSVVKFQNDGKAFRKWRSLVWQYTYQQLDLVTSGQRTKPTIAEFLLELPTLEPLV